MAKKSKSTQPLSDSGDRFPQAEGQHHELKGFISNQLEDTKNKLEVLYEQMYTQTIGEFIAIKDLIERYFEDNDNQMIGQIDKINSIENQIYIIENNYSEKLDYSIKKNINSIEFRSLVKQMIRDEVRSFFAQESESYINNQVNNFLRNKPNQEDSIVPQNSRSKGTLFAESPVNNRFTKVKDEIVSCETFFELDTQNCTFDLVKNRETLQYAFDLVDVLKPACELFSVGKPTIDNYKVERVGLMEIDESGYWTIKEKIKLTWTIP